MHEKIKVELIQEKSLVTDPWRGLFQNTKSLYFSRELRSRE